MSEPNQFFYTKPEVVNEKAEALLKGFAGRESEVPLWDDKLEQAYLQFMSSPLKPQGITEQGLKFDYLFNVMSAAKELPGHEDEFGSKDFMLWFLSNQIGKDLGLEQLAYIYALTYTCDPLSLREQLLPFLDGVENEFAVALLDDDGTTEKEWLINSWQMVQLLAPRLSAEARAECANKTTLFYNDLIDDEISDELVRAHIAMMRSLDEKYEIKAGLTKEYMSHAVEHYKNIGERSIVFLSVAAPEMSRLFNRIFSEHNIEPLNDGDLLMHICLLARQQSKKPTATPFERDGLSQQNYADFSTELFKKLNQ